MILLDKYLQISNENVIEPKKMAIVLHDIRNLIIMTNSSDRESLVNIMGNKGFFLDIVKFMKNPSIFNIEILEEITWIFLLIFSSINEEKMLIIIDKIDIIALLVNLMKYDEIEIFSNIIWCFANIINDNQNMKQLFIDLTIIQKIEKRMEIFEKRSMITNPSFYQSYMVFLDSYFCTYPYNESQGNIKIYLRRLLGFYIDSPKELLACFELDLLNCIKILTHFINKNSLKQFLNLDIFGNFLSLLFTNLNKKNKEIKNTKIQILVNLTSDLIKDLLSIFEKKQIQKVVIQCLKDPATSDETINLVGNILLKKRVYNSIISNENMEIFEILLMRLGEIIELRADDEDALDDILRTVQIALIFGEYDEFILFCLKNISRLSLYN
jgi:hypothetical protein